MKLIFGVFITVLLAVTMAFSQQYPIPQAAIAGGDFFSQTVARQATADSLVLAAKATALCGSSPECEPWSGLLPSSMASNAGATDRDIFNETVAIEANANRLVLEAKKF
ncbi:MAG: hypothetical protein WA532_06970 [Candidatus Korobacteraceae bacterium]